MWCGSTLTFLSWRGRGVRLLGGDHGIHTLYWHCKSFLRAAALTLCGDEDVDAVAAAIDRIDETQLYGGVFALRQCTWVAPIVPDDHDDVVAESASVIAGGLPKGRPPSGARTPTGCIVG